MFTLVVMSYVVMLFARIHAISWTLRLLNLLRCWKVSHMNDQQFLHVRNLEPGDYIRVLSLGDGRTAPRVLCNRFLGRDDYVKIPIHAVDLEVFVHVTGGDIEPFESTAMVPPYGDLWCAVERVQDTSESLHPEIVKLAEMLGE